MTEENINPNEFDELMKKYGISDESPELSEKSEEENLSPEELYVNNLFNVALAEYEEIREETDETEKSLKMDVFFIKWLCPFFLALEKSNQVKNISVERFGRTDGVKGHWYVPMYIDRNGIHKMGTRPYPYKATGLMKMMAAFTTMAGTERIF